MKLAIPTTISYIRYFFVPFSEPLEYWADPLIIVGAIVWAITVASTNLESPFNSDDLSTLNGVLTGTLGFLLPLYLSTCIDKNKKGIELYDAFCGDILALGWEVAAYGDQSSNGDGPDLCDPVDGGTWLGLKKDIFNVLEIMPDASKHVFRNDFQYHYLVKEGIGKQKFDKKWTITDPTVNAIKTIDTEMKKKLRSNDECADESDSPIEAIMFYLVIQIRKIPVERERYISIMMKKWNDIYSSYGTTASLINYKEPMLFSFVLYTAMLLYVLILPFTFVEEGSMKVLFTGLIIYFFLSLNSAGKLLQNPFRSLNHDLHVFETVSKTAENTRCQLRKIKYYGKRKKCPSSSSVKFKNPNSLKLRFRPFKD